jgi:hypothetical protein
LNFPASAPQTEGQPAQTKHDGHDRDVAQEKMNVRGSDWIHGVNMIATGNRCRNSI